MEARIAILICLCSFPLSLSAQEKPSSPIGFPPGVGTGKTITLDGKVRIDLTVASLVQYAEEGIVERDGKKVCEVKTRYRTLMQTGSFFVNEVDTVTLAEDGKTIKSITLTPLGGVGIFYKNGKPVVRKDLPKLFEKGRAVLVFGGEKIDPYYQQVIHDEVLIVTGAGGFVFPPTDDTLKSK